MIGSYIAASARRLLQIAVGVVVIVLADPGYAHSGVPSGWSTDCVGRMQLSLPGSVEVAAVSKKDFVGQFASEVRGRTTENRFADDQVTGYDKLFYNGSLYVTHVLDQAEWMVILESVRKEKERVKVNFLKDRDSKTGKSLLTDLGTGKMEGYGWQSPRHMRLVVRVGDVAVRWASGFAADQANEVREAHQSLVSGLRPRQLMSLPAGSGVCLPHLFVDDDGQHRRSVGTTYRLNEHPDVTVLLEDSSAHGPASDTTTAAYAPEYKTNFFWTQRYQSRKSVKMLWHHLHDVKLDGRKGVASFVELTRDDDTIDYGYLAVVRGDPDAKTDTPDLMLYVIRDAKNAIAKGKQPIDKAEFLEMAEAIAASVKHRPTQ
jgi:Tle cognate immunity protein 4 C-terminal domain